MRTAVIAALLGTAMLASPALAQSEAPIQTFTKADFKQAVETAGGTFEPVEGSRNVDLTFKGSIKADGLLMACEDADTEKDCYGTSILATFNPREGTSDEAIAKAINDYNYNENFGRAYRDPDGVVTLRMYIISDGSISRENYSRQIQLWFNSVEDFFDYLYP